MSSLHELRELPQEGEYFLSFADLLEVIREDSVKHKYNFRTPHKNTKRARYRCKNKECPWTVNAHRNPENENQRSWDRQQAQGRRVHQHRRARVQHRVDPLVTGGRLLRRFLFLALAPEWYKMVGRNTAEYIDQASKVYRMQHKCSTFTLEVERGLDAAHPPCRH